MTTHESVPLERAVRIAARPETIFAFFTDPLKMMQWQGVAAVLDPRPGGVFRVDVTGREVARGEYVEVVPYSRLVFTWGWEGSTQVPPGSSTVEVTLVPDGAETVVRLRHVGLPGSAAEAHASGWDHYLPRLIAVAQGADPGPDTWAVGTTGAMA
jgi:uncharacterized protein YndB with AHSA1/START domain